MKKMLFKIIAFVSILLLVMLYKNTAHAAVNEFQIPVGVGESKAAYVDYSAGTEGPMDFCVVDDVVYLLDSENERIMVFDENGWVRNIILGFYSNEMELLNQELYVINYWDNEIVRYTLEGEEIETYLLRGIQQDGLRKLIWQDNRLKAITNAGQIMDYDSVSRIFTVSGNEIKQSKKLVSTNMYFDNKIEKSVQKINNRYNLVSESVASDKLYMVQYLVKENENGQPIGYYDIDWSDWSYIPKQYLYLEGDIPYIMLCYDDSIVVKALDFVEEHNNGLQEILSKANEGKANLPSQKASVKATNKTSLSRTEVIMRAEQMRALTWTLNEKHKVVRGSAILPKVVSDTPAGRVFTGIPYCWGGFFGLSDPSSDKSYIGSFLTEITKEFQEGNKTTMYMAGNVNGSSPGYIGKTIGLDCSGFVSSAYDLSNKESTGTLKSNYYSIALSDIQLGDILVSTIEGHVLIYGGKNGDNYVVYDCNSSNSTGRVLKREVTGSYISSKGYVARTPWAS